MYVRMEIILQNRVQTIMLLLYIKWITIPLVSLENKKICSCQTPRNTLITND